MLNGFLKHIILILFLCLLGGSIHAKWLVEARNAIGAGHNTMVFISTDDLKERVKLHLGFKAENATHYFFQDEFVVSPGDEISLEKNYKLKPGAYTLEVLIGGGTFGHMSIPYTCETEEQEVFVSDIFLSDIAFSGKQAGNKHTSLIADDQNHLHFQCELLSQQYQQLTARAVLYRERRSGTPATVFTSIQQQNKVIDLVQGQAFFQGAFDLQELEVGAYLVEVLIFEDDQLLRERSVRFSKEWQGYAELLVDLDLAINMLEPIASQEEMKAMLSISEEPAQRAAFESWWANYASDDILYHIQAYYQKLDKAASLFSDELPVWKSDRGKTYLLYGNPIRQEIVKNETQYERWYYEEWDMLLWFRKEGANFIRLN